MIGKKESFLFKKTRQFKGWEKKGKYECLAEQVSLGNKSVAVWLQIFLAPAASAAPVAA
jgi:hypothetical protein